MSPGGRQFVSQRETMVVSRRNIYINIYMNINININI